MRWQLLVVQSHCKGRRCSLEIDLVRERRTIETTPHLATKQLGTSPHHCRCRSLPHDRVRRSKGLERHSGPVMTRPPQLCILASYLLSSSGIIGAQRAAAFSHAKESFAGLQRPLSA